jgi:hypothetical protein
MKAIPILYHTYYSNRGTQSNASMLQAIKLYRKSRYHWPEKDRLAPGKGNKSLRRQYAMIPAYAERSPWQHETAYLFSFLPSTKKMKPIPLLNTYGPADPISRERAFYLLRDWRNTHGAKLCRVGCRKIYVPQNEHDFSRLEIPQK